MKPFFQKCVKPFRILQPGWIWLHSWAGKMDLKFCNSDRPNAWKHLVKEIFVARELESHFVSEKFKDLQEFLWITSSQSASLEGGRWRILMAASVLIIGGTKCALRPIATQMALTWRDWRLLLKYFTTILGLNLFAILFTNFRDEPFPQTLHLPTAIWRPELHWGSSNRRHEREEEAAFLFHRWCNSRRQWLARLDAELRIVSQ